MVLAIDVNGKTHTRDDLSGELVPEILKKRRMSWCGHRLRTRPAAGFEIFPATFFRESVAPLLLGHNTAWRNTRSASLLVHPIPLNGTKVRTTDSCLNNSSPEIPWILNAPQRTFSPESLQKADSRKTYGVDETVSGPPASLIRGPQAWLAELRLRPVLGWYSATSRNTYGNSGFAAVILGPPVSIGRKKRRTPPDAERQEDVTGNWSILAARAKSYSVRPPMEWVQISIETLR